MSMFPMATAACEQVLIYNQSVLALMPIIGAVTNQVSSVALVELIAIMLCLLLVMALMRLVEPTGKSRTRGALDGEKVVTFACAEARLTSAVFLTMVLTQPFK